MKKVTIIDYGMGNINSVRNAFSFLGCDTVITQNVKELREAKLIVLPGVGAFGDAIKNLHKLKLIDELNKQVLLLKKPFFGVCLGMQLLAERSFEKGKHMGLGWIPGEVIPLDLDQSFRVPHMGWNEINPKSLDFLLSEFKINLDFYFVHSYWFKCKDLNHVHSTVNYGSKITASVKKNNIFATQFHPERSHQNGLKLLKRYLQMIHETNYHG